LLSHSPTVFENEFVTNTMHGLEVNGTGRIWLEFLAQPQNVVINRASAGIIFKAPDLIQEFVPGDHPPRTRDKEPENFELKSGENNWYVRASDFRPE
jgi:hypothetical protein